MTKYSMRHLLCIALFLLYCTCGCFGAVVQQLPQKGKSALQTYTVSTQEEVPDPKNSSEWQPIRIGVYTKFVEDLVNYFETKDKQWLEVYRKLAKRYESDVEFGVVEDSEEDPEEGPDEELAALRILSNDEKMTTEKKKILFTEVLPKAIKLHTDRLKVEREKSSPSKNVGEYIQTGCYFFKNPLKQKVHESPEVDFMIFASLSNTYRKVVICTQNKDKRPTSAVIRFIPSEINATRQYIRFTAHEIAHGLGFQHRLMNELKMIEKRESDLYSKQTIPGKEFYMVKSTKTVEMLKKHYDCQNDEVKGLYLENENTVTPSHWERRIAKDELMSTYSNSMGATGMYYTELTLGVFHDMPFYSANFSMAEPMSWGNKSQCEFLKGKQDPKQAKYSKMFCEETDKVALQCTTDRFALGVCLTEKNREKLPNGYHYFENDMGTNVADDWMDGYPIIKPLKGTFCEGGDVKLLPGSILSNMSRCLNLNKPLKKGENGNGMEVHGICAKVKCDNNNKVSVLKGNDVNNEEHWHKCEKAGETIELKSDVFSGGSIVCPEYKEVCTGLPETELPTIKFYNGTEDNDADDTLEDEEEDEEEEEDEDEDEDEETEQTAPEDTPLSPPPNADDVVDIEKEPKVPIVNDNNGTQVDTKPESTGDNLPQVPTNTSKEEKEEEEEKNDDNEPVVVPSDDTPPPSTTNDSVNPSVDTTTVPSDESHNNVSDNSNANEIPPHNMDSSQKDDSSNPGNTPETEDSQEAEIPPKEEGSSKPESSDNSEGEKNTTDSKVENTGKDSDNSIAVSFFGPLLLLVCVAAAVVAL